jgi:predicted transcriptional regulator YheO
MNPGSANKEKKIKSYTFVIEELIQSIHWFVCLNLGNKSIEVAKFGTSYISIIGEKVEQKQLTEF